MLCERGNYGKCWFEFAEQCEDACGCWIEI